MTKGKEMVFPEGRLISLDFFRGIIMFLLIGDTTKLFKYLISPKFEGTILYFIGNQFHHQVWHGLHFWDLVQPFFMFMVGVAIPFAVNIRLKRGESHKALLKHALKRSVKLFFLGWILYWIAPGKIIFRFTNVLVDIAFAYLISFMIIKWSIKKQILFSFVFIALTELLFRVFSVGAGQAFAQFNNFGARLDMAIFGQMWAGGWVTFNVVPTISHTIWGLIAGKILMSDRTSLEKIKILALSGLAGIIIGYGLDTITPIIKHISTSSFMIVSGGWAFLALALSYWMIDVRKYRKGINIFIIVGMNSLFIYLFSHAGGTAFLYNIVKPITYGLFSWVGEIYAQLATAAGAWVLLIYLCYWLYKRKIFIKV